MKLKLVFFMISAMALTSCEKMLSSDDDDNTIENKENIVGKKSLLPSRATSRMSGNL